MSSTSSSNQESQKPPNRKRPGAGKRKSGKRSPRRKAERADSAERKDAEAEKASPDKDLPETESPTTASSGSSPLEEQRPQDVPQSESVSKPDTESQRTEATEENVKATETTTALAPSPNPLAPPLLKVEGLTKTYAGRTVVHRVSFAVDRGEVIGLLGKNGAGKTTTFRMTIGMITPDAGKIYFNDHEITSIPMYRRARLGMGYLSQEPSVFRGLSTEDNLNAILELTPLSKKERVRRRDELVEEFGLGKLLHSKASVLSGGEKRRLEIARALIMQPKLILLDEPFSGVDPIAVQEIQQIIINLKNRGIGILLTDHNVRETLNTTDRSFIILDGRIIASGDRQAILSDPNARKYYLGERFQM
jgi:lipopolysaccharide export system ATP-binding protein